MENEYKIYHQDRENTADMYDNFIGEDEMDKDDFFYHH